MQPEQQRAATGFGGECFHVGDGCSHRRFAAGGMAQEEVKRWLFARISQHQNMRAGDGKN